MGIGTVRCARKISTGLLTLIAGIIGITSTAEASPACRELDAEITYRGVTIEPPNPKVGDEISLAFDVDVRVYSPGPSHLMGAEPLLAGDTMEQRGQHPAFHLTAVAPGTATLTLSITYLTEEACEDYTGHTIYRWGQYHTVNFDPFELHIAEQDCTGDCDESGDVTVDEIIWGTNIALGDESVGSCTMFDRNDDGGVAVDDVVAAIYSALHGCN